MGEEFIITIGEASAHLRVDDPTAIVTIYDPPGKLRAKDLEACSADETLWFDVEVDEPRPWPVDFEYQTIANGNAVPGTDYQHVIGSASIAANGTLVQIPIAVSPPKPQTLDLRFGVRLFSVQGADLADAYSVIFMTMGKPEDGDANRDCRVDARDLSRLLRALSEPGLILNGPADCEGDGLDSSDLECATGNIFD